MPLKRPDRRLLRVIAWALLLFVLAVDALIRTPLSLGLLYVVPLAIAALSLSVGETVVITLLCAGGRLLFGPAGDPLGLADVSLMLSPKSARLTNDVVVIASYLMIAALLLRLERQRQAIDTLGKVARVDPLTGLANRRRLSEHLAALGKRGRKVAALALDLDHFKAINDRFGHDGGDRVLRELAQRLTDSLRPEDLVARTGGEELVVLLAAADEAAALEIAERLRSAVADRPVSLPDGLAPVTVSIGVAVGAADEGTLLAADEALYRAKRAGRNRVERAVLPNPPAQAIA